MLHFPILIHKLRPPRFWPGAVSGHVGAWDWGSQPRNLDGPSRNDASFPPCGIQLPSSLNAMLAQRSLTRRDHASVWLRTPSGAWHAQVLGSRLSRGRIQLFGEIRYTLRYDTILSEYGASALQRRSITTNQSSGHKICSTPTTLYNPLKTHRMKPKVVMISRFGTITQWSGCQPETVEA